jgi:hypothetical protein
MGNTLNARGRICIDYRTIAARVGCVCVCLCVGEWGGSEAYPDDLGLHLAGPGEHVGVQGVIPAEALKHLREPGGGGSCHTSTLG